MELHNIPAQSFNYAEYIGLNGYSDTFKIRAIEISDLITYGKYKTYLEEIKIDSSTEFYLTQLPDSNMCLSDCYEAYLNSTDFDSYPVVGISWEAALHYCKWLTIKSNTNKIDFIYRLPTYSEWVSVHRHFSGAKSFNENYSEWVLNSYDESGWSWKQLKTYGDYIYLAKPDDPPVLKRKRIIGNSFLFQREYLKDFNTYGYSYSGYRQNGFRVIIEKKDDHTSKSDNYFKWILIYWGLIDDK